MRRAALLLLTAVWLAGCATAARQAAPEPGSADHGRFVVLRSCAGCHSVGGDAPSPDSHAPPFWRLARLYAPAQLRARLAVISRSGHVEMPPIYMTGEEIEDIAAYVAGVAPPASGPAQSPGRIARFQTQAKARPLA